MKKIISLTLAVIMLSLCFILVGCNKRAKVSDFIGEYNSIYRTGTYDNDKAQESQTKYKLTINKDNTFKLNNGTKEFTGTWKSYSNDSDTNLLCTYKNETDERTYYEAFSVSLLDDKTLMMQYSDSVIITLFEKAE